MLKVDEAKARLSEWRLPEEEDRIEREVGALPEKLRKLAKSICWRWTDEERAAVKFDYDYEKVRNRKRAAAVEVDQLPVKERAKIFGVVSPGLAPHMEQTWQLLKTTPYQAGHTRKAFRAPHDPELLAEILLDWMIGMAELGKRYPANVLTPTWLATWTPHLTEDYHGFESEVASLLAGVLNQKNKEADEVFDILL